MNLFFPISVPLSVDLSAWSFSSVIASLPIACKMQDAYHHLSLVQTNPVDNDTWNCHHQSFVVMREAPSTIASRSRYALDSTVLLSLVFRDSPTRSKYSASHFRMSLNFIELLQHQARTKEPKGGALKANLVDQPRNSSRQDGASWSIEGELVWAD